MVKFRKGKFENPNILSCPVTLLIQNPFALSIHAKFCFRGNMKLCSSKNTKLIKM